MGHGFVNVSYEREGFHNYMVIEPEEETIPFEITMINQQQNCELLPVSLRNECLYYNVDGKQLLEDAMKQKPLDYVETYHILDNLIQTLKNLEEYMLLADSIVLHPDLLYIDRTKQKLYVCYIPGYQGNIQKEFCGCMELLMSRLNHLEESLVVLVYGIYHITKQENYSLQKVEDFLLEKKPQLQETELPFQECSNVPNNITQLNREYGETERNSWQHHMAKMERLETDTIYEQKQNAKDYDTSLIHTNEVKGEPDLAESNVTMRMLRYQMGKCRQQRVLYGMIVIIMLCVIGYLGEEIWIVGKLYYKNIWYAACIVFVGAIGSFAFIIKKIHRLKKEIINVQN